MMSGFDDTTAARRNDPVSAALKWVLRAVAVLMAFDFLRRRRPLRPGFTGRWLPGGREIAPRPAPGRSRSR